MNGKIGLVLSGLALLLNIVGLAIPFWWYISWAGGTTYNGLWQVCGSNGGTTACFPVPEHLLDTKFQCVRAMELLGMIGMIVATVCVLLKLLVMKENDKIPKIAGGAAIVSGILMIIGTIIFTTIKRGDNVVFHAGFALCLFAGTIALPAGVFDILNK